MPRKVQGMVRPAREGRVKKAKKLEEGWKGVCMINIVERGEKRKEERRKGEKSKEQKTNGLPSEVVVGGGETRCESILQNTNHV